MNIHYCGFGWSGKIFTCFLLQFTNILCWAKIHTVWWRERKRETKAGYEIWKMLSLQAVYNDKKVTMYVYIQCSHNTLPTPSGHFWAELFPKLLFVPYSAPCGMLEVHSLYSSLFYTCNAFWFTVYSWLIHVSLIMFYRDLVTLCGVSKSVHGSVSSMSAETLPVKSLTDRSARQLPQAQSVLQFWCAAYTYS